MRSFWRALERWGPLRTSMAVLGAAWIAILAAYVYGGAIAQFTAGASVAAACALAFALAGFMYAWRQPAPHDR